MNYMEFKNKVQNLPVIVSKDLVVSRGKEQSLLNQLYRWQRKGLIIKLKKGMYLLNKNDRKVDPSRVFLACQIYSPSYISLEYALSFYGLIPERVADITCVTTRKTTRFKNELGNFIYQHIKPLAFRGFVAMKDDAGFTFFIAEAEKAVVDLFYLNLSSINLGKPELFTEYFRFQNTEELKSERIIQLAAAFRNTKLTRLANLFCEFIEEEKR